MKRFIKPHVMKDIISAAKLAAVEVSRLKSESLLYYSKIDIGFEAETAVKQQAVQKKKAKDKDILEFHLDCCKWLMATVCKLLDKAAVQYTLARNLAILDPRTITDCETNQSCLRSDLQQLVQFNRVVATNVDDILHQYQDFADSMIRDHQELFTSFSPTVSRLDTLMVNPMSRNDSYSKLWKVVKMLLVLSHGQATVELGFSVNKQNLLWQREPFVIMSVMLEGLNMLM